MIMKAIVVNGPGDMQLVERPMPEIKEPNQEMCIRDSHCAGTGHNGKSAAQPTA